MSFSLPDHLKRALGLLQDAAGEGCLSMHEVQIDGKPIRDDPIENEQVLQQVLIDMIPVPGDANTEGGPIIRALLAEFLSGFSLRILIFLLDMVLPQLDAYHSGRQLQHLQPWVSVALTQQQNSGQPAQQILVTYQYEAYAGFHVIQFHTEGAPLLLFCDPNAVPQSTPWELCEAGNLGSMESNVMVGRALLSCLHLPNDQRRCAIFLVLDKVMQGTNKAASYRAYRRIAPIGR